MGTTSMCGKEASHGEDVLTTALCRLFDLRVFLVSGIYGYLRERGE